LPSREVGELRDTSADKVRVRQGKARREGIWIREERGRGMEDSTGASCDL
jgi:hypothetical protein